MINDLVSIIIPVYNLDKYISICLDSLIIQSYKNIEIVIVDDGSTDKSIDICKLYKDKFNNIYLFQQTNKGVSSARNLGILMSHGSYICFVDGDDYCDFRMIESLLKYFDNSTILTRCGVEKNQKSIPSEIIKSEITTYSKESYLKKILNGSTYIGSCATLLKRDILNNIKFNVSIHFNEDKLFLLEYILKSNGIIKIINHNYYFYYCRTTSVSHSPYSIYFTDIITANEIIYDMISYYNPSLNRLAKNNIQRARIDVLEKILLSNSYKKNAEIFNQIKKTVIKNFTFRCSFKLFILQVATLLGKNMLYLIIKINRYIKRS